MRVIIPEYDVLLLLFNNNNNTSYSGIITLSVLTAILLGEPRLAGSIKAKDDTDNWSYKLQSIVTTNKLTPNSLEAGCHSCHPTNSVRALKGDQKHTIDLSNCSRVLA